MKRLMFSVMAVFFAVSLTAANLDTVKGLLPDAGDKAKIFKLSDKDKAAVEEAMGKNMPPLEEYEIYVSKTGVVVIEEQKGKWSVIKIAVLIDPEKKAIKKVEIISMNEKRGQGIKRENFLKQFVDKTVNDLPELNKGVRAVTGATVSAKAVFIAAKRALVVYGLFAAGSK